MTRFKLGDREFSPKWWQRTDGAIGMTVAIDTETTPIQPGVVPDLVVAQAYAGGSVVWLLRNEDLLSFLELHARAVCVFHNAAFDISVLEKAVGFDSDKPIRSEQVRDVALLYRLHALATEGASPERWALDLLAKKLLNIDLPKDDEIRMTFGQYLENGIVRYDVISQAHIEYACKDPIATFALYKLLWKAVEDIDPELRLSYKIQMMGSYGLNKVENAGIGFDTIRRDALLREIDARIEESLQVLARHGYVPGNKGVKAVFDDILSGLGISLPRTKDDHLSTKAELLEPFRQTHLFVDSYLKYRESKKLKDTLVALNGTRIHTRFNALLDTGRTSSMKPNLQNVPRGFGVRECFIPAPGHCFLIIDYSQLELCTLAQVCIDMFGFSKMAELLNQGKDLHCWLGGLIAGRVIDKDDPFRQRAKSGNFGFPGGLGTTTFLSYALQTFGVTMTENEAKGLKQSWLEAFPEMKQYLADTLPMRADFSTIGPYYDLASAHQIFRRIISGQKTKVGREYSDYLKNWAFNEILPAIAPHLKGIDVGSPELFEEIAREPVMTRTGRIRARATYCQARNTRFQGLASDGMKIALYRLIRAGHRVGNEIHDEFLIEVPLDADRLATAKDVERTVIGGMQAVVPDVAIQTEWFYADRWYKKGPKVKGTTEIYRGEQS